MENTLEYFLVPVTDYSDKVPEWKRLLPPGMTFDPEDIEIFKNYLLPKVKGEYFTPGIIQEADVYQCQPSQLPGLDPEHGFSFYFTKTERRYENGSRTSRRTKDQQGNWKITSKINKIKDDDGQTIIGKKNVLVYYMSGNNVKTNWIMHEYILDHKYANQNQGDKLLDTTSVVFCRIYQRKGKSDGSSVRDIQENHKRESSSQSDDHHEETRCNYQAKRSKSPLYVQPISQQPLQPLDQVAASNYMITSSITKETTFNVDCLSSHQAQLYNPFDVQPISQQPSSMMMQTWDGDEAGFQPLDKLQLHHPFDVHSNGEIEVTNSNNYDFDDTDSFFIGGYF